jgi:hypothetical protein
LALRFTLHALSLVDSFSPDARLRRSYRFSSGDCDDRTSAGWCTIVEILWSNTRFGYYSNLIEEPSALMESLANNHAFIDGNKRVRFVMTDAMLRANGYFLEVEPFAGHKLITEAMAKNGFRFPMIRDWIASIVKPLAPE